MAQVPPDPDYRYDYDDTQVGDRGGPASQGWKDSLEDWWHAFMWETNDLLQFNRKAALTLAGVSAFAGWLIGSLLF
ncbi:hypothetical protein BAJUN_02010 [Bajunvirus bajun]|uniref:Uncharacterized protein n=1 Tax=Brevundimonas phage vB_BgoS-Bajun TaxID=2948594 RepID=A0A9E7N4N6_9CAUD|nr:hypothetical protein BAJUN_02010 [Brevundimonas phage vB_BgoS-Bajun]